MAAPKVENVRRRVNFRNPYFLNQLRRAEKGNKAVAGANTKGLVSSYALGEIDKLSRTAEGARRRQMDKKQLKEQAKLNKRSLDLGKERLDISKQANKDAYLGSMIGLGIGGLQTGLGAYDTFKSKQHNRAQQALKEIETEKMFNKLLSKGDLDTAYRYADLLSPGRKGLFGFFSKPNKWRQYLQKNESKYFGNL